MAEARLPATERLQPQSHITRQLALLLSVTHEQLCSTLDSAAVERKNPLSGLCQAAVCILLQQLLLTVTTLSLVHCTIATTLLYKEDVVSPR